MSQAIYLLANRDESYQFRTGAEVLKVSCLRSGRARFPDHQSGPWRALPPPSGEAESRPFFTSWFTPCPSSQLNGSQPRPQKQMWVLIPEPAL